MEMRLIPTRKDPYPSGHASKGFRRQLEPLQGLSGRRNTNAAGTPIAALSTLHAFLRKPHGLYHLLERDLVGWVVEVLLPQSSQGAHGPGRVNTRFCLSMSLLIC
jgi:hypothetical protein